MGAINFFNSMDYLEPKCPECKTKIEYGITTRYNEKLQTHVCLNCGHKIE